VARGARFFQQRPEDLPDPRWFALSNRYSLPADRSASLQSLARAGALLAERLTTVDGERISLDGSVTANIDFADAFADRIRRTAECARRASCPGT
jgi:putative flavoprotein involved in K+ transport